MEKTRKQEGGQKRQIYEELTLEPTDWQRMDFLAILIFTALSQTCKGSFWKVLYLISCMRILVSLLCVSWRLFLYINFIFQEIVFVEVSSLIDIVLDFWFIFHQFN